MLADQHIDLMIIGAQKAGTTSLLRYLGEHPQIAAHEALEFAFFLDEDEFQIGFDKALIMYFGNIPKNKQKLVCKNAQQFASEKAIQRLKEHNPNCKIVLSLRDPVSRTYSSYLMEKLYGRVDFEFDLLPEKLKNNALLDWQYEALISFSAYSDYLEILLKYFPKEQIRLVIFEEFAKDPLPVVREIFTDLNVNADFMPRIRDKHNETTMPRSKVYSGFLRRFLVEDNWFTRLLRKLLPGKIKAKLGMRMRNANKSGKSFPEISPAMRDYLRNFFAPSVQELENKLNLNIRACK